MRMYYLAQKLISDFKQNIAIQTEKDAATVLHSRKDNFTCTLHDDSTQRSKIDGDQICLFLIFSDSQKFSFCLLFFAYEDGEKVVKLIVETYTQLALLLSKVTAKNLWGKTIVIMTVI